MFQIKVKKKPKKLIEQLEKIAKGNFKDFTEPAGGKIRDDIIGNIKHQITPEGDRLKKNKPETLRIKKRMGWGTLSLIAQFRLLISQGTYVIKAKKQSVELTLAEVRKNIGKILEAKGYRFFGISDKVRKLIFSEWRQFIKRGFQ